MSLDTAQNGRAHDGDDSPYMVVSIDSHLGPLFDQLRPYCPSAYLERYDQWVTTWTSYWGGKRSWFSDESPITARWGGMFFEKKVVDRQDHLLETTGIYDPEVHLKEMDADGVAAELVYHTAFTPEILPFQSLGMVASYEDLELEAVGLEMYNRWLVDFVSVSPDRFIGAAYVPIWDIEASARTVRWARESGLKCINFPAPNRAFAAYNDPAYEPFWAACSETELPLTTHGGAGDMPVYEGKEAWALYSTDLFYFSRRGLMYLIWAGVFERYPNLKLVFTEQRSDWVPEALSMMDSIYHSEFQDFRQLIPEAPSHYFNQNCYVGVSFMARFEAEARHDVGVNRLMWGRDYPHFEGTWGYTLSSLRNTFSGVPVDDVRRILGYNAVECFGLDRDKLTAIAREIGPTPKEIATPLEELPEVRGLAFRTKGAWS
jgi:predicted TIM-barrel fold metal-dependent hydrolase